MLHYVSDYLIKLSIRSSGGDLLNSFRGATQDYIHAELDRRKSDLKTQLVWVGAQKEPGITARTWKWVNGEFLLFSFARLLKESPDFASDFTVE